MSQHIPMSRFAACPLCRGTGWFLVPVRHPLKPADLLRDPAPEDHRPPSVDIRKARCSACDGQGYVLT